MTRRTSCGCGDVRGHAGQVHGHGDRYFGRHFHGLQRGGGRAGARDHCLAHARGAGGVVLVGRDPPNQGAAVAGSNGSSRIETSFGSGTRSQESSSSGLTTSM